MNRQCQSPIDNHNLQSSVVNPLICSLQSAIFNRLEGELDRQLNLPRVPNALPQALEVTLEVKGVGRFKRVFLVNS